MLQPPRIPLILGLFFCALIPSKMVAQPGGGGGLFIGSIYDANLKKIDRFRAQLFELKWRRKTWQPVALLNMYNQSQYDVFNKTRAPYFLPPYIRKKKKFHPTPNQRLVIIRCTDTMVIDFIGIIGINAGGESYRADSIVFEKGHFICYKIPFALQPEIWKRAQNDLDFAKQLYTVLDNGITPASVRYLKALGLMETTPVSVYETRPCDTFLGSQEGWVNTLRKKNLEIHGDSINLKMKNIRVPDSSEFPSHLSYKQHFDLDSGILTYRFVYHQCFVCLDERMMGHNFYDSFFQNFKTHYFFVNDSLFSGSIKIAFFFTNRYPMPYPMAGFDLYIYRFKNGRLMRENKIRDANLWTETRMMRL